MDGGTASKLGGGKFANGAVAGAFGRLYNEERHYEGSSKARNSWLRLKNTTLCPFGLEDKIVIGENMKRVSRYADQIGADYYGGLDRSGTKGEYMSDNIRFVIEKMDQGFTVLDIGTVPGYKNYPDISSEYYAQEIIHIGTRNGIVILYEHYHVAWDVFRKEIPRR